MSFKGNISPTGRDFFFNPAGNNAFKGSSVEISVEDPTTAIARVNALSPPPGPSDPASINASVTGLYATGVVIPEFTTCNSGSASILTSDAVNVECGDRQTVLWGSLLNFSNNGICCLIDGKVRTRAVVNSAIPLGDNGVGFRVDGDCDEVFVQLIQGVIGGDGGIMFHHTATSPTPIEYTVELVKFTNTNQTLIEYNPPNVTDQVIMNISSAQEAPVLPTTSSGSMCIHALSGTLVVDAEVLQAETLLDVEDGARLGLDAQVGFGDAFVRDNGFADLKSIGFMNGNIVVEPLGVLNCDILNHIGTVLPSDPGAGPIDGIIDNKRYGKRRVLDVVVLSGADTTIQNPTGIGAPLKITFGAAQANPEVSVNALGDISIDVTNEYFFRFEYQPGRNNNGGVAEIYFRVLVDGVQTGESIKASLNVLNDDFPVVVSTPPLDLISGQVVTAEMVRSITGSNDGSLFPNAPVQAGWTDAPSALVTVTRRT